MNRMIKSLYLFVLIFSSGLVLASLPTHAADGEPLPSLAPMLKKVNPAVVNIATFSKQPVANNPLLNDPFFRRFFNVPDQHRLNQPRKRKQAAGSGVIVDAKNGYVVTNYHVIKNADEIQISLNNGKHYVAEKLGVDPDLDIAILKIVADGLVAAKLADSAKLQVGDFVVAIGNPFALGQTVTTGIVSALGRSGLGIEGYENFIQTDASINPGNSGGALVNLRGELIGINTAILSPAGGNIGIGFSIPINMVKNSLEQIIATGEVKRGQIGINIQDVTPALQEAFDLDNGQMGVFVTNVLENSPAEKAGIKVDDVIIAVDNDKANSSGKLKSLISSHAIGHTIKIKLLRDGKEKTLGVKIGSGNGSLASNDALHQLLKQVVFENSREGEGVVVKNIARDAIAAYSGLRQGDLIVGANRRRVTNINEFSRALEQSESKILLRVVRGRSSFYLVIQ